MEFDWDLKKALSNQLKHLVSFEEAITIFDDPNALIATDVEHSTISEKREWIIGETDQGKVLVVVFTI